MSEKPFTLHVPDSDIEFLKKKLELTRLPDELDGAAWDYGTPLDDVKRLLARWKDGFDWRASEVAINKLPQFTRDIEVDNFGTLNIHYVHQKSQVENAIPLLFVHGWPGHFLEVSKILPLLVDSQPDQPSFHVVALSLPGFGFSEAPKQRGFGAPQYAEVSNKLMLSLGYNEYVVQGGDWGFMVRPTDEFNLKGHRLTPNDKVARKLSLMYRRKNVKAWHTNFPVVNGPPKFIWNPLLYLQYLVTPYGAREQEGFARSAWFQTKGMGYHNEQSTQPQTIGYSLADSPIGLLAWIYEKLVQWTDSYPWTDDEILQWISVYWFSRAGPAATVRIYSEVGLDQGLFYHQWSSVPLGLSYFPKELLVVPKIWARTIGNVVFESEHNSGGHFAAHEKPEELVGDLKKMFGKGGPAYGVVTGKDGYTLG